MVLAPRRYAYGLALMANYQSLEVATFKECFVPNCGISIAAPLKIPFFGIRRGSEVIEMANGRASIEVVRAHKNILMLQVLRLQDQAALPRKVRNDHNLLRSFKFDIHTVVFGLEVAS